MNYLSTKNHYTPASLVDSYINSYFDNFLGNNSSKKHIDNLFKRTNNFGAVNFGAVTEDDKNYYIELDVPGYTQDHLEISLENNILTIKGVNKQSEQGEGTSSKFRGEFTNTFRLSSEVNGEEIEAKLEHGVLLVTIPKSLKTDKKLINIR